jgi:hypothetical protein
MSLPKLNAPIYTLKLPSSGKTVKFRPFLVKEEKLLMIANETGDHQERSDAIGQIIENCTYGKLKYSEMPTFDVEYMFLNLRAKSVSEEVVVKVLCPDDNETYAKVKVDLMSVKCIRPKKKDNLIMMDDKVGILMKYPTMDMAIEDASEDSTFIETIKKSVLSVFDGDAVYEADDFTDKELQDFIESMNNTQFQKIIDFFKTLPKVHLDVDLINPKTKVKGTVRIEGIESFF